ncbi:MAG: hypothetical protein M0R46_09235 [Candidatus Muirbacterium halophilum]|nr:hypothetical protein [Candidatus Muirbacterium halophilum]
MKNNFFKYNFLILLLCVFLIFIFFIGCVSDKKDNNVFYSENLSTVDGFVYFPFFDSGEVFSVCSYEIFSKSLIYNNSFKVPYDNYKISEYCINKNLNYFLKIPLMNDLKGFYYDFERKVLISPITSMIENNVGLNDVYAFLINSTGLNISIEEMLKNPYKQFEYFDVNLPFNNDIFIKTVLNSSIMLFLKEIQKENIVLTKEFLSLDKTMELFFNIFDYVKKSFTREEFFNVLNCVDDEINSLYFKDKIKFSILDFVNGTFVWLYLNYDSNDLILDFNEKIRYSAIFQYVNRIKKLYKNNESFINTINKLEFNVIYGDFKVAEYSNDVPAFDKQGNIKNSQFIYFGKPVLIKPVLIKPVLINKFKLDIKVNIYKDILENDIEIYLNNSINSVLIDKNHYLADIKDNILDIKLNFEDILPNNGYFFFEIKKKNNANGVCSETIYLQKDANIPPEIISCNVVTNYDTHEISVNINHNELDKLGFEIYLRKNPLKEWDFIKKINFSELKNGNNSIKINTLIYTKGDFPNAGLKLIVFDNEDSDEIIVNNVNIHNNILPEILSVEVLNDVNIGNIDIKYSFDSKDFENTTFQYEYSLDGITYNNISTKTLYNQHSGYDIFTWETGKFINGVKDVYFKITPQDLYGDGVFQIISFKVQNSFVSPIIDCNYNPSDIKIRKHDDGSIHVVMSIYSINNPEKYSLKYFTIKNKIASDIVTIGFTDKEDVDSGYYKTSWDFVIVSGVPVIFSYYNHSITVYKMNGVSWSSDVLHNFISDEYGRSLSASVIGNSVWLAFYAELLENEITKSYLVSGKYNVFANIWTTNIDNGANFLKIDLLPTEFLYNTNIILSDYNEPLLLFMKKSNPLDNAGTLYSLNLDSRLLEEIIIAPNVKDFIQIFDNTGKYYIFYIDSLDFVYKKDIIGISLVNNSISNNFIYAKKDFNNNFVLYYGEYNNIHFVYNINDSVNIIEVNSENSIIIEKSSNIIEINGFFKSLIYYSNKINLLEIAGS